MKKSLISVAIAALSLFATSAYAAGDCEAKAVDKNGKALAGAAKTSFIKKCEKESAAPAAAASPACEKSAADKKLAGAAKTSHIKKCMADEKPAGKK
ncbi:MAG: putative signal peptide protein [Pseudomonadota bacterium]